MEEDLIIRSAPDVSGLKYGDEVWIKVKVNKIERSEDPEVAPVVSVNLPVPREFAVTGAASTTVVSLDDVATVLD